MTQSTDGRVKLAGALELRVYLDGVLSTVRVGADQVDEYYRPLSQLLLGLPRSSSRLVVGVAGPPGSGKTVFASVLVSLINSGSSGPTAAALGLDGWHFPASYLASHSIQRDGRQVALIDIKGSPETFDVAGALESVARIREGYEVTCPAYDRVSHEPVPDALPITKRHGLVIFEGNYVLLEQPPWSGFRRLFDLAVYVAASQDVIVPALLQRHQRGGKSEEDARRSVFAVDLRNAELVRRSACHADVMIVKADEGRIAQMTVRRGLRSRLEAGH